MPTLFLINIPYNCSDVDLKNWVESRGLQTVSIRLVRDMVSGVSPSFGYIELNDRARVPEAISKLNGNRLWNQTILVKEAQIESVSSR